MKITHTAEHNEHLIILTASTGILSNQRGELRLTGRGSSKHEAVKNILAACEDMARALNQYPAKLSEL